MTPHVLNRVSNNCHKRHQVNIRWLISLKLTLSRATDESIEEYMQSLLAVKHKLWNSQWKYLRFGFNLCFDVFMKMKNDFLIFPSKSCQNQKTLAGEFLFMLVYLIYVCIHAKADMLWWCAQLSVAKITFKSISSASEWICRGNGLCLQAKRNTLAFLHA